MNLARDPMPVKPEDEPSPYSQLLQVDAVLDAIWSVKVDAVADRIGREVYGKPTLGDLDEGQAEQCRQAARVALWTMQRPW